MEIEKKVKKWGDSKKELEKKHKAEQEKSLEKIKKKLEKIELEAKKKEEIKKEENKKYIEGLHDRSVRVSKENSDFKKVIHSPPPKEDYRYLKYDRDFKEKLKLEEEMQKDIMSNMKAEKREKYLKPISFKEINRFNKWYVEVTRLQKINKSKERITKLQAIEEANEKMVPFTKSKHYDIAALEEHENRLRIEKQKSLAHLKRKQIENFSKIVNHHLVPKIDTKLKKEREERMKNHNFLSNKPKRQLYKVKFIKKERARSTGSISVGRENSYYSNSNSIEKERPKTPESKKRKNVNVYLKNDFIHNRPLSVAAYDHENEHFLERVEFYKKKQKIRDEKVDVRKSLDKLPDYLGTLKKLRDVYLKRNHLMDINLDIKSKH